MEQAEIKALAAAVPSHLWGQPVQRLWEAKGHLDAGGTGHLWPCRPSCRPSNTPVCSPLPAFAFTVSRPHVTGSSQGHLLPRAGLTISSRPAHSPPQQLDGVGGLVVWNAQGSTSNHSERTAKKAGGCRF